MPEIVLTFDNIRIKMTFLYLLNTLFRVLRFSAHIDSLMSLDLIILNVMLLAVIPVFRLFRKPPDKFYQIGSLVIQVLRQHPITTRVILMLFRFVSLLTMKPHVLLQVSQTLVHALIRHLLRHLANCKRYYFHVVPTYLWTFCKHSAFVAQPDPSEQQPHTLGNWDSDSFPIVIDSATSRTITPFLSDLLNAKPYDSTLKGIGNGRTVVSRMSALFAGPSSMSMATKSVSKTLKPIAARRPRIVFSVLIAGVKA